MDTVVPPPCLDRELFCMGTRLRLHLEGADRERLVAVSARILEEIERIEAACSTWRPDSAWSRLNQAGGGALPLAAEWLDLLEAARIWQGRTGGAFDPVVAALMRAWGIREGGRTPTPEVLAEALRATGAGLLILDRVAGTARLGHPGAGLEEGGFVKGHALDAAARVAAAADSVVRDSAVRGCGTASGWFDFGGQILAWGAPLEVAVAAPEDRLSPGLRLLLPASASLSCSGCSERGRHLLDPRSGLPCPDWGMVAVVAASGFEAEVLSTALYVEGPERGPALAGELGAAAAFLSHDGGRRLTPAFQALGAGN